MAVFTNKKGSSYVFLYGLFFIVAMALTYIVFTQIINQHIYPIASDTNMFNLTPTQQADTIDRYVGFWGFMPLVIILVGIIYMIYHTVNQDNTGGQY